MSWATFWAISFQRHLATLCAIDEARLAERVNYSITPTVQIILNTVQATGPIL
jgi:hypothetical protein